MKLIVKELFTPDEIRETARIYIDCIREDYSFKPKAYLESLEIKEESEECGEWLESDRETNRLFGAYTGGEMAGYIATGRTKVDELLNLGEITGFFVRNKYRGKGIGRALLKAASEFLDKQGFSQIVIYNYARSRANAFYRRLGGKVLKREIQRPGGMALETDIFIYETSELLDLLNMIQKEQPFSGI